MNPNLTEGEKYQIYNLLSPSQTIDLLNKKNEGDSESERVFTIISAGNSFQPEIQHDEIRILSEAGKTNALLHPQFIRMIMCLKNNLFRCLKKCSFHSSIKILKEWDIRQFPKIFFALQAVHKIQTIV